MKYPQLLMLIGIWVLLIAGCRNGEPGGISDQPTDVAQPTATLAPAATEEPANADDPSSLILVSDDEPGERLVVTALVLDESTGEPVSGGEVYVRHTSVAGSYEEDETGEPRIHGTLLSDADGRVRFETIVPGAYADDPTASRHMHVTVSAGGYESLERVILFDNDPNLTPAERAFEFGIVAEMAQAPGGEWTTEITLPLAPAIAEKLQRFVLTPGSTTATYHVEEEFFERLDWLERHGLAPGSATAVGSTDQVEGFLEIDLSQKPPQVGDNAFSVDLMSLTSDQEGRDNTVRRDVFGDGRFATATFVIHSLEGVPDEFREGEELSFTMYGKLTIREVTQPAAFVATATLAEESIRGVATTRFQMGDFGIEPPELLGILSVSEEVTVTLVFAFEGDGS